MASCRHLSDSADSLRKPNAGDQVYREDCTICFDSVDDAAGLDVCVHCYNGACAGERAHSRQHAQHFQHPLALNIKRTRKRKLRDNDSEPPEKMSKLEIKAETNAERYHTETDLRCLECGVEGLSQDGSVGDVVQAIMTSSRLVHAQDIEQWALDLQPCDHTYFLQQDDPRQNPSGDLGHCKECDLKENLWLCLTCGNLGCGRRMFDGSGGNNHQVEHATATKHPLAVKLGSLSADGQADCYCYQHDDDVKDPKVAEHLAHWGINIADRVKTEKGMGEMQAELNFNYDFSMTDAGGNQLKPLFGPELTGLSNLGNSCYLASVVQALYSNPEFSKRYYRPDEPLPQISKPAEDIEVQLRKLADGLISGRYSIPDPDVKLSSDPSEKPYQKGITPAMFKQLVGKGHPEFSTGRQQDSFELLQHLLKLISRSQRSAGATYKDVYDPVDAFRFYMEQKLQCLQCKKVRYRTDQMENISVAVPIKRLPRPADTTMTTNGDKDEKKEQFEPVTFKQCLDDFTAPEVVELTCAGCGSKGFTKQSLFKTFPTILAVNARRFEIVNWVPTKQDVPVIVGDESYDMEAYRSKGKQDGEEELPEEADASASGGFVPNEVALEMLMGMGFPRVRCEKALQATGNADPEAATGWLFEHMEDPDIDVPLQATSSAAGCASSAAVDPEKIENLGNMGFSAPQARQALKETGGDMERAVDWLFSHPDAVGDFGDDAMPEANGSAAPTAADQIVEDTKPAKFSLNSIVCHKGSSIHAGHYVAFIKKKEGWVLFNDEKVALGGDVDEMKKFAYIYFFRREVA